MKFLRAQCVEKALYHVRVPFQVHRTSATHLCCPIRPGGELPFKVIDLKTCTPDAASASPGLRTWSRNSANPVPRTFICTYLDEMQDLMITVNLLGFYTHTYGLKYQINLHTISTGEKHPLACVPHIITQGPIIGGSATDNHHQTTAVTVLGDLEKRSHKLWCLQVWNWHQAEEADVGVISLPSECLI
jgi:hypothetical protein